MKADKATLEMLNAFSDNDRPWSIYKRTEKEIDDLLTINELAKTGEFDFTYEDICKAAIMPFIHSKLRAIDALDVNVYKKNVIKDNLSYQFLREIALNPRAHIPELNDIKSALDSDNIKFQLADLAFLSISNIRSGVQFAYDVKKITNKANATKPAFLLINLIEHNINQSFLGTPANKEVVIKFDGTQSPAEIFKSITKTLCVSCDPHFETRSCYFEGITSSESLAPGNLERWKSDETKSWYADAINERFRRFTEDEPEFDECTNRWSRELVRSLKENPGMKFYRMIWGS